MNDKELEFIEVPDKYKEIIETIDYISKEIEKICNIPRKLLGKEDK